MVRVNGEVETRRKRQLHTGDRVAFQDRTLTVTAEDVGGRGARPGAPTGGETA
jgi:hypothetical protein